jgi:hypothetical protein
MLPSFSRGLRLALVLALGAGFVALQGHSHRAFAQEEEGEEEDAGGDDKEVSDEGDDPDDKDQPPITAGGLFTMSTYPVRELHRPLTMTQNIAQIRVGLGTDISAKGAFETGGLSVEGQYGYSDNFTIIAGVTNAYNFKQYGFYAGFEGALVYDLVDIRVAANIHRNAIPDYQTFCNPPATPNEMPNDAGMCSNQMATQDVLPSGDYFAGGTKFSLDLGFPFRYAIKPEIAIVALQTLMSIDFNEVSRDNVTITPVMNPQAGQPTVQSTIKGNGAKPDLNPSIGIATNPIPQLSIVAFAQLRIPDFDTSAGAFQVPVTARVEVSPNQKFDIGLEFTLLNVKPPEGQSPIDNRFISLFVQSRFGK